VIGILRPRKQANTIEVGNPDFGKIPEVCEVVEQEDPAKAKFSYSNYR